MARLGGPPLGATKPSLGGWVADIGASVAAQIKS